MSIKFMSSIWENGPSKMTDRFVLLCIADFANDAGEAWPAISSIMRKTTLSERGVQGAIRRLESDGWLEIQPGNGRRNTNLYIIKTPQDMPPHMTTETPHMSAENPAGDAPNPSRTIIEPSKDIVDQAFDFFCETMKGSNIPIPRKLTQDRRRKLKAKIAEHGEADVAQAIRNLRASAFCNGQNDRGWVADLDFLLQAKSFNRLLEGGYASLRSGGRAHERPLSDLEMISRRVNEMMDVDA